MSQPNILEHFISPEQLQVLEENCSGEEGDYFRCKLVETANHIQSLPKTGDQESLGLNAVIGLHYFLAGADWYITEIDKGAEGDTPEQYLTQCFGLADLFQDGGELGYISIPELLASNAELDLYWKPQTLAELRVGKQPDGQSTFNVQAVGYVAGPALTASEKEILTAFT